MRLWPLLCLLLCSMTSTQHQETWASPRTQKKSLMSCAGSSIGTKYHENMLRKELGRKQEEPGLEGKAFAVLFSPTPDILST